MNLPEDRYPGTFSPAALLQDTGLAAEWNVNPKTLARFSGGSRPVGSFGRSLGNEVGEKGLKDVTGVYNRVGHEAKCESWLKTILGRNHAVTGGCAMRIQLGLFVLCELVCAVPQVAAQSGSSGIVISQVYGGGGNSGTTLRNDFIELINRGSTPITVTGWSVQYASATGTAWDRTLLSGAIQPGQYYLIQEAQGNGGSASLPAPDLSGGINLSATDGKIALVNNSTALDGAAPSGSQIIDFVGYGGANAAEGSPVAALDNTTAAIRKSGGCSDTNNNRVDFSLGSPAPRNSHSPTNLCSPLPSKPDLVVTALAAPTSGTVGGTLTPTSMTVKNQGGTAAGQFRVGYYLSPSAGMTSSAVYTGTYCSVSNGLAASSTFNCSNSIGIPSSLSPGTWYLLALADDQGQVDESDKTNNLRASDGGAVTLTGGAGVGQPCGVERWPVKTGTDADAKLVNLNNVTPTTIANLTTLAAPSDKPENNRVQPTETTLFVLNATLTEYKLEDDSDYHLIFSDSAGKTMIAEVPSPYCVGSGSPFAAGITNARSEFDAHFKPSTDFKTAGIPVKVTGVGFFDFLHGQNGIAPNGIELHPVLDIIFNPTPTITSVNSAGGFPDIAQNDWIEIKGTGLAPSSVGPGGMTWSNAPEFAQARMPTQLNNVSVKVNGKSAYVYYLSETQINVLTPLDGSQGQVSIVVTNGTDSSSPFAANMHAVTPSLLLIGASKYAVATHANGSLLGPLSMSVPGYPFTPAQPGETVVLYAVGFGLPTLTLVDGSATQFGTLPTVPIIQIGAAAAAVQFAGIISPGLYQFNVIVPTTAANGDNPLTVSYDGLVTPVGSVIAVQR